jgi:hypothetical protein
MLFRFRLGRVRAVLLERARGENSPSRWPTMLRDEHGLKTLPLCTVKVRPTNSGVIIERRDQVLIGVFWFVLFAFWIFSSR